MCYNAEEYQIPQNTFMRKIILIFTLGLFGLNIVSAGSQIERAQIYDALSSSDVSTISAQIASLAKIKGVISQAFTGALEMRKAGLLKLPIDRLKLFKHGNRKLEAAIKADVENAEFRFLRLIIQEQTPAILGYKDDLEKDKDYLRSHYKNLPAATIQAILNYCTQSKFLKTSYFQEG